MEKKEVLLSIITICFNAGNDIKTTLQSVLQQDYSKIEYIVIDGGSTDNTVQIIKDMEKEFVQKEISFSYISEKDNGIYHAMNKGRRMSHGEWIHYLNAGDLFAQSFITRQVMEQAKENNWHGVVYGDYFKKHGEELVLCKARAIQEITNCMCFCHQAAFVEREYLERNPFDERLKIVADHNFFMQIYIQQVKFHYLPLCIAIFDCTGISQTSELKIKQEEYLIKRYNGIYGKKDIMVQWVKLQYECMYLRLRQMKRNLLG